MQLRQARWEHTGTKSKMFQWTNGSCLFGCQLTHIVQSSLYRCSGVGFSLVLSSQISIRFCWIFLVYIPSEVFLSSVQNTQVLVFRVPVREAKFSPQASDPVGDSSTRPHRGQPEPKAEGISCGPSPLRTETAGPGWTRLGLLFTSEDLITPRWIDLALIISLSAPPVQGLEMHWALIMCCHVFACMHLLLCPYGSKIGVSGNRPTRVQKYFQSKSIYLFDSVRTSCF